MIEMIFAQKLMKFRDLLHNTPCRGWAAPWEGDTVHYVDADVDASTAGADAATDTDATAANTGYTVNC